LSPPQPAPSLRLVDSGSSRPDSATYRRRRLAVVLAAVVALAIALAVASVVLARPATAGGPVVSRQVHLVQPGETYWSIAAANGHGGDLRLAVDELIDANGGRALFPGDQIELPSLP
jgi:hypothetical protein